MNTLCLLIVDVQKALVDEGPDDLPAFLDRLKTLVGAARKTGVPVVHVQHSGPAGDELEPGKPGWEIAAPVKPLAGEPVFGKRFNSSFKDTGLEGYLRDKGWTTLVIVGMQTEHCIDATVKAAFDRGFSVVIPGGAQTTFPNGDLSAARVNAFYTDRIWNGRYAKVQPVDEVVKLFHRI